jgi:hypothetical protein
MRHPRAWERPNEGDVMKHEIPTDTDPRLTDPQARPDQASRPTERTPRLADYGVPVLPRPLVPGKPKGK